VHEPGTEPLQELPLAEDDRGLVADAGRKVGSAADRLARPDQPREKESAPCEQGAGDRDRNGERDR
jgi:hypothetical protein